LKHDKVELLSDEYLTTLNEMGTLRALSKRQELAFARVSELSIGLPLQMTNRLVDRCGKPIRRDLTTLTAFLPAIKELLEKGALTGSRARVQPLLKALALMESNPLSLCNFALDNPIEPLATTHDLLGLSQEDIRTTLKSVCQNVSNKLHSLKLTWPLKIGLLPKRKLMYQPLIFRGVCR